ncbi:MAG: Hpt domain-containing protein [Fimbriimonadaceae bacterium]|nr:Hpt domain-containing protein [Fimbriimonadaceae bacterium]
MDGQPQTAEWTDADHEDRRAYRDLFFAEADELLGALKLVSGGLGAESDPGSLERARRATHTLKAHAACMGYRKLARLVHELESAFGAADPNDDLRDRIRDVAIELGCCRRRRAGRQLKSPDVDRPSLPPVLDEAEPKPPLGEEGAAWVRVVIAPDCRMPAARAMLLMARVSTIACRLVVSPPPATWQEPGFSRVLTFWVDREAVQAVARALRTEPEVRAVLASTKEHPPVPLSALLSFLGGLVEDLALQTGKELALSARSDLAELPHPLFAAVRDALVHLVRNAADHGIETPEERQRQGKPATGRLCLAVLREPRGLAVSLADDGRGFDQAALRRRAVASRRAPKADPLQLAFMDGLTTRDVVTELSGRGVGLAAVRDRIEAIGGSAEIASEPLHGSKITLRIPLEEFERAA